MFMLFWLSCLAAAEHSHDFSCDDFLLVDKLRHEVGLRPRDTEARLIDTFAYGNDFEIEELILRLSEMGPEVSEFHIVEGDRDFQGALKGHTFQQLLSSGRLDEWKDQIIYHKVKLPQGVTGFKVQHLQREKMDEQMHFRSNYKDSDVLLEGDLDEIVSRKALRALKRCEPESGEWNLHIKMAYFKYSLAWSHGNWGIPTTAAFFHELKTPTRSFIKVLSIWQKPGELRLKDGGLTGWHVTWMLNGSAGIAHKAYLNIEQKQTWFQGFADEAALADFLDKKFIPNPAAYDPKVRPSNLTKKDLPQAVIEHPERYPTILRNVTW